jgi:hypothetical protein
MGSAPQRSPYEQMNRPNHAIHGPHSQRRSPVRARGTGVALLSARSAVRRGRRALGPSSVETERDGPSSPALMGVDPRLPHRDRPQPAARLLGQPRRPRRVHAGDAAGSGDGALPRRRGQLSAAATARVLRGCATTLTHRRALSGVGCLKAPGAVTRGGAPVLRRSKAKPSRAGRRLESQPAGTSQRYDPAHCHPGQAAPPTSSLNSAAICAPAVRVPTTLGDQRRAVGEVHQPQRVPATPYMVASWGRWFGLCPAQGSLQYWLVSPCRVLRRLGRAGDLGPHRR